MKVSENTENDKSCKDPIPQTCSFDAGIVLIRNIARRPTAFKLSGYTEKPFLERSDMNW